MSNLNEIEAMVDALDKSTSNDDEFNDAYAALEEAGTEVKNDEIGRLRNILDNYRSKLPNRSSLIRTKKDAKDLADALMLATLADRITRINARNEALTDLNGELDVQIAKGNADAARLSQIKKVIDKASATVTEVKNLIDQLTVTDATAKSRIKALVEALDNISSIFA